MKHKITYLNLVDEALDSTLHSLCLLDLGDLLMGGPVVPTLAPYIDVLATIMGAPWISSTSSLETAWVRLSSALPPTMAKGTIGPLPWAGTPFYVDASIGGSSTRAGDGALFSSSTTLLSGVVPTVPSSLVGVLVSAPSRAGSSATLSTSGQQWAVLWAALGQPAPRWSARRSPASWPRAKNSDGVNV